MFKFDYVPAEQLKTFVEFTPGRAQFIITAWTDKNKDGVQMFTQSGAPRIDIILEIADCMGAEGRYFDMLTPNMNWKLKAILDAVCMPDLYTPSGVIDLNLLIGKGGQCNLTPPTGDYKKLNIQYLSPKQAEKPYIQPAGGNKPMDSVFKNTAPVVSQAQMDEYDNQIPF
jgi:hypothetical protein